MSERIGISPWYWWADVTPKKKSKLSLPFISFISNPPSVKYRSIFINDEDWGLQPWAAKTFEPETGDIGPKTYSKIFELLLRLKANLLWPAMHPCTKAFYHYPKNREVADESFSDKSTTNHPSLKYDFYTLSKGNAEVKVYCLPTHARNANHQMRIAISVDGQEPRVTDYRTFDRSETWKQNVLGNSASNTITHTFKEPGSHTLAITALDPLIIIDRITIDFGGLKPGYAAVPETKVIENQK